MTAEPDDGLPVPGPDVIHWSSTPLSDNYETLSIEAKPWPSRSDRFVFRCGDRLLELACLTADEQAHAWGEWRNGQQCADLIRDMAAGEVDFSSALNAAFMAGLKASSK